MAPTDFNCDFRLSLTKTDSVSSDFMSSVEMDLRGSSLSASVPKLPESERIALILAS
jgi:hypothetical protein